MKRRMNTFATHFVCTCFVVLFGLGEHVKAAVDPKLLTSDGFLKELNAIEHLEADFHWSQENSNQEKKKPLSVGKLFLRRFPGTENLGWIVLRHHDPKKPDRILQTYRTKDKTLLIHDHVHHKKTQLNLSGHPLLLFLFPQIKHARFLKISAPRLGATYYEVAFSLEGQEDEAITFLFDQKTLKLQGWMVKTLHGENTKLILHNAKYNNDFSQNISVREA